MCELQYLRTSGEMLSRSVGFNTGDIDLHQTTLATNRIGLALYSRVWKAKLAFPHYFTMHLPMRALYFPHHETSSAFRTPLDSRYSSQIDRGSILLIQVQIKAILVPLEQVLGKPVSS